MLSVIAVALVVPAFIVVASALPIAIVTLIGAALRKAATIGRHAPRG